MLRQQMDGLRWLIEATGQLTSNAV
jgi:hypothetical protein